MKKTIITILLAFTCMTWHASAQDQNRLFPYPTIDDETMTLAGRCNYMVYNFWERCNIKQSFSSLDKLNQAFGTWASFMPYATADTVHMAIDNYIKAVNKQAPKMMAEVGKMAQNWFYCDTAEYQSEELYEPFCKAVVESKKVPKAEKALFQSQYTKLINSGLGKKAPDFAFITPSGEKGSFDDVLASRIVLFFSDPDCLDCSLIKARLSADYNFNQLIDKGLIKIACIYPGEATDEWKEATAKYPDNWVVGASPDIDVYFDFESVPAIYYLDGRHKILGKNVGVDNLLFLVSRLNQPVSE